MNAPKVWGSDDLSAFLKLAQSNMVGASALYEGAYERLQAIDQFCLDFLKALDPIMKKSDEKQFAASFQLVRSHSCYRAAVGLSLAGQVYESYAVDRACIESALYGLYIARTEGAGVIWLNRDKDSEAKKTFLKTFNIGTMTKLLGDIDKNLNLGEATKSFYDRCIDLGAHPNPKGMLRTIRKEQVGESEKYNTYYLIDDDTILIQSFKDVAIAGLVLLEILCLVFENHPETQRIKKHLPALAKGL